MIDTDRKDHWPVMNVAEIRAAEQAIFDAGMPVIGLMEEAGAAVAEAIERHAHRCNVLIVCGPGNNGGDGYIVAHLLRERGWNVRVAALGDPGTEVARMARKRWGDQAETFAEADPAPLFVDACFGIGLSRPLDTAIQKRLSALAEAADYSIAIDLPSGVDADNGRLLGTVPAFDLTVALGTIKPAHIREPAARICGKVVVGDIGLVQRKD